MAQEDPSRTPKALLVKLVRRVLLNCTLEELWELSGVNPDLLSRHESGKTQPTAGTIDRILRAAGSHILAIRYPLLIAVDQVAEALNPGITFDSRSDPLFLRQLLDGTARRMTLMRSIDDGRVNSGSLTVQFVRRILLNCTLRELSDRTGIHENLLARYEAGKVDHPIPENLDLVLDAGGVLRLKPAFLPAIIDLASLLQRPSRYALHGDKPAVALDKKEIEALVFDAVRKLRDKLPEE